MVSNVLTVVGAFLVGLGAYWLLTSCSKWEWSRRSLLGWLLMLLSGCSAEIGVRGTPTAWHTVAVVVLAIAVVYVLALAPQRRREVLTDWGVLDGTSPHRS